MKLYLYYFSNNRILQIYLKVHDSCDISIISTGAAAKETFNPSGAADHFSFLPWGAAFYKRGGKNDTLATYHL